MDAINIRDLRGDDLSMFFKATLSTTRWAGEKMHGHEISRKHSFFASDRSTRMAMSMREGGMGSQRSNSSEAWVTQDNKMDRPRASRPGPISTSFLRSRAHDHGAWSGLLRLGLKG